MDSQVMLVEPTYFNDLLLPHNIDVMHTEKNIAEAIFGTIMDIPDKTKDNIKARLDQGGYATDQSWTWCLPEPASHGESLRLISS